MRRLATRLPPALDSVATMKIIHSLIAAVVLCGCAASSFAQHSWLDKDGRKVYSDRPPPAGISDKNVLQRPSATAQPAAAATSATASADGKPAARPKPTDDARELAAKMKAADDAEAARKQAEQDRTARTKADNCLRAQQAQSTYASNVPLSHINAQGERVVLDDTARAAETQRLNGIIASDCH